MGGLDETPTDILVILDNLSVVRHYMLQSNQCGGGDFQ